MAKGVCRPAKQRTCLPCVRHRPSKLAGGSRLNELKSVDSFVLLERTCSSDAEQVGPAREELAKRGFSEVHFDLRGGCSTAIRRFARNWSAAPPELRSIDAAPWLLQLSHDSDADVRLTAITLMATSGDPSLLEEVERLAGADSDPAHPRPAFPHQSATQRRRPARGARLVRP